LQAIFPSTSSYRLQASSYLFAAFAFFATTVLAAELLAHEQARASDRRSPPPPETRPEPRNKGSGARQR
jgi:hypothetical protein